jgi:hypothetical protein
MLEVHVGHRFPRLFGGKVAFAGSVRGLTG